MNIKDKYDKNKQVRALMANLIDSLNVTYLSLLFNKFLNQFDNPQFFSIHDCFGTTCDKVTCYKNNFSLCIYWYIFKWSLSI